MFNKTSAFLAISKPFAFNNLFLEDNAKPLESLTVGIPIILTPKFKKNKDLLIKRLHGKKIFSRPVWKLLSELKPYKNCSRMNLSGSKEIYERSINIPSSQYLELK